MHEHELEEHQGKRLMMATHFAAAMISTISDDAGYDRLKRMAKEHGCGKVSSFITKESWRQAENLLLHHDTICARELKNLKESKK